MLLLNNVGGSWRSWIFCCGFQIFSIEPKQPTLSFDSFSLLHILQYLARYTHRVAISNHRLVAFQNDRVSFRWKDYAHGGKQKIMTVSTDEFLRRFLIHVLPKGWVRIRHFGLSATAGVAVCSHAVVLCLG